MTIKFNLGMIKLSVVSEKNSCKKIAYKIGNGLPGRSAYFLIIHKFIFCIEAKYGAAV